MSVVEMREAVEFARKVVASVVNDEPFPVVCVQFREFGEMDILRMAQTLVFFAENKKLP